MTAGRHNLSRRAVLGACFGVPVLLGARDPSDAPFALSLSKGLPSLPDPQERDGLRQPRIKSGAERDVGGEDGENRWTRALAAFRRAEVRLTAFQAEVALLPAAARAFPAAIPLDERFDRLEGARLFALRRLLRAPAPGLAALSLKLDLAIADQAWELTGAEPCLAALGADARRLARAG
jgi:hypothetical protein